MVRKSFLATDAIRERVRSMAARGHRQEDIATVIGCDAKTLRKHFRNEIDRGTAEANAEIVDSLFASPKKGNFSAQIFLAKVRLHWRECRAAEPLASATNAKSTLSVIILPDNSREPGLTEVVRKAQDQYLSRKRQR